MMPQLKRVERAIGRLAKSDTPRKRHNARLEFNRALRALAKATALAYPKLRPNGEPVEARTDRQYQCPICRVPVGDVRKLAVHLGKKHDYYNCPCGKYTLQSKAGRRHLASVDLAAHWVGHVLRNAGRPLADVLREAKDDSIRPVKLYKVGYAGGPLK
jgi:hypothetical protein